MKTQDSFNSEEVAHLASQLCEGVLDAAGVARLEFALRNSPGARRLFLEYLAIHGELYWQSSEELLKANLWHLPQPSVRRESLTTGYYLRKSAVWLGLATAVLLVGWGLWRGGFAHLLGWRSGGTTIPQGQSTNNSPLRLAETGGSTSVAWVEEVAGAEWELVNLVECSPDDSGNSDHPGESAFAQLRAIPLPGRRACRLETGSIRMRFASGVRMAVEGPAELVPLAGSCVALNKGTAFVQVPVGKPHFVVETPFARIIDRGTSFGVHVADEWTEIHCLEGKVEIAISVPDPSASGEGALPSAFLAKSVLMSGRCLAAEDLPGCADDGGRNIPSTCESVAIVNWNQPEKRKTSLLADDEAVKNLILSAGQALRIEHRDGKLNVLAAKFRLDPWPSLDGPVCVARFRQAVRNDPRLRHHFPFEGWSSSERRLDRRGGLHLAEVVMFGGSGGGAVDYQERGLDSSTRAVRFYRGVRSGNTQGVALQTLGDFEPPRALTVELLLRMDPPAERDPQATCVAVGTRASADQCSFWVVADGEGRLLHLFDANSQWLESGIRLLFGQWYYVAVTVATVPEGVKVNVYCGPLDGSEARLQRLVAETLVPGSLAKGPLGVGKGFQANLAHAYPWPGAIDELAIYEGVLEEETLQAHYRLLLERYW